MLAHDRLGQGPPLVLLHGTNSARGLWRPVLRQLAAACEVVNVDLPAHGASAPTSFTPPGFARDVAALLDELGLDRPAVVGHSVGGWTALELAKLGRAGAVLALTPAGLWARRSPKATDAGLVVNWALGQVARGLSARALRSRAVRRVALRGLSARPGDVPPDLAADTARTAVSSRHFPRHFRQTRVLRFEGGAAIPADVPVRVVWGGQDHLAIPSSRRTDELPAHARVETWDGCGHMVVWDRPREVVEAALGLTTSSWKA